MYFNQRNTRQGKLVNSCHNIATLQKWFLSQGSWVMCCLLDPLRLPAAAENKNVKIEANRKMLPAA